MYIHLCTGTHNVYKHVQNMCLCTVLWPSYCSTAERNLTSIDHFPAYLQSGSPALLVFDCCFENIKLSTNLPMMTLRYSGQTVLCDSFHYLGILLCQLLVLCLQFGAHHATETNPTLYYNVYHFIEQTRYRLMPQNSHAQTRSI